MAQRATASHSIRRALASLTSRERAGIAAMGAVVLLLNVVGWSLLALAVDHHAHASQGNLFGVGTGVLAYTLGMRHAFDADHIAAIDNTTRKLVGEGKRPLGVGFSFSLGHSTVVFMLAILLNFGIHALNLQVSKPTSGLHAAATIVGTSVSGTFLYLIALINLRVLVSLGRLYRRMHSGVYDAAELEQQLNQRGLMNRVLGRYARRIDSSRKMYPVGVLFGLGFDTATEIALLVLAGSAVVGGLPLAAILALPVLFAAGMCLFDTLDGCFMNFAYGWAFANPVRKIFYNLTITGLSVAVAFIIGSIELLGLVGRESGSTSPFWSFMRGFNINEAGFAIVGLFVVTWAIALLYWRLARIEKKLGVVPGMSAQGARSTSQGLDGGDPDHRPVQRHTTG